MAFVARLSYLSFRPFSLTFQHLYKQISLVPERTNRPYKTIKMVNSHSTHRSRYFSGSLSLSHLSRPLDYFYFSFITP